MPDKILYVGRGKCFGGRNGFAETGDGVVAVDLSMPKSMDGPGSPNCTTPEDLFAAAYAAAFGSTIKFLARELHLEVKTLKVEAAISLIETDAGGYGLGVGLEVSMKGPDQGRAEEMVRRACEVCPYSVATRGNAALSVEVQSVPL